MCSLNAIPSGSRANRSLRSCGNGRKSARPRAARAAGPAVEKITRKSNDGWEAVTEAGFMKVNDTPAASWTLPALDWRGQIAANADARGDFGQTESFMEYTITAAFLLAVVAGSLAAVILGGYAHLIASAL